MQDVIQYRYRQGKQKGEQKMIVREGNNKYEVVMKNGKPFLRMWHPIYDWEGGYHDCMI